MHWICINFYCLIGYKDKRLHTCLHTICTTAYMNFLKKTSWLTDICPKISNFEPPFAPSCALQRLQDMGSNANLRKSVFMQKEVEYLGFLLTSDGIKPQPKKIEAINQLLAPTILKKQHITRCSLGWSTFTETYGSGDPYPGPFPQTCWNSSAFVHYETLVLALTLI